MLSLGIFEIGKNIFVFKNDVPYSADVKPTVNKNWFGFISWFLRACYLYVYTAISMHAIPQTKVMFFGKVSFALQINGLAFGWVEKWYRNGTHPCLQA